MHVHVKEVKPSKAEKVNAFIQRKEAFLHLRLNHWLDVAEFVTLLLFSLIYSVS